MDACAIRDKQGNPLVEDGYLSFICEESDNIVRVDPNQFDFSGSEPYVMEHGGVKYNLYLYNNPDEGDSEIDADDPQNEHLQKTRSGSSGESAINVEELTKRSICTPTKDVWTKESTKVLMDLYQEIGDSISFTFHPEMKIWGKISEELQSRGFNLSPLQVENKFKTIEMEDEIKLKQDQRLPLESIDQESQIEKKLNNRKVKNILQTNENIFCIEPNALEHIQVKKEPVTCTDSNDIQEIKASEENSMLSPEYCEKNPSHYFKQSSRSRKKIGWNKESSELLLDLYKKYSPGLGKVGKFTSKTQLWCKISEDFKCRGYCFSPVQVQSRWRNLNVKRNMKQQCNKKDSNSLNFKENENEGRLEENCNNLSIEALEVASVKEEKEKSKSEPIEIEGSKVVSNKDSSKAVWTEEQAELLIDVYKETTQNHNLSKFGSKKYIWKRVAQELKNRGQNFTHQQVHSKWKSLQRSLKSKLEKLRKSKLHQASLHTSGRFNHDQKLPLVPEQVKTFTHAGSKPFGLPLEVVLNDSSDENSESLFKSCNMIAHDGAKSISESLDKLTSIKETYYKDRLILKEKKLKAFEERTIEIRKTNDLLKQFLNK